ncbi:xanthine dehydrogenase family protein molybdopterin-binding subunit [Rhodoplanes sp. Z2-YC6860]|uniref:xanthine dehydrogenase family protein molybdopterin-binding subunit n=1 Tax=Rhodoplanes sp. Z2-YC6860 TaxID=674703 RepID=UPI00078E2FF8|nr:molybdopterin cofactor-binding domain-containing protein [Rhodoplanes sp. Z2-YC6860]AMN40538.1 isoquinoline 1-oxidoreductase subunit beta IorB, molybdoprotein [Rhodoplanes sp. Z2-YC6860]
MSAHHFASLPRRDLLKGALVIGFSLALPASTRRLSAAPVLHDPKLANSWIAIGKDNSATVYLGKVELGQGNGTSMLQLVAEELDIDLQHVSAAPVDTAHSMNQGATVSSSSIQQAGPQLRSAAAEIRAEMLRRASEKLRVPADELSVSNGVISGGGRSVAYGELIGPEGEQIALTGKAPQKSPASYKVVGSRVPRRDLPAKVKGTYEYMQHAAMPGMLHGRVVRPKGQGGYGQPPKIRSVDEQSVKHIAGVQIVRERDFVGVVAPRQWDAVRAAEQLKVDWELPASLPGDAKLHDKLRSAKTVDTVMLKEGDVEQGRGEHLVSGKFYGPYQAHGSFSPSCALADVKTSGVLVQCSSQDVFALRDRVALVVGAPKEAVQVQYIESSGCFGHNCQDDVALAAVLMSKHAGKPVRVQFMRWDELGWDNYGPAHVGEGRIGADKDGRLSSYEYQGWHHGWMIEETSEYLATGKPVNELAKGPGSLSVNKFDTGGMYDIPNRLLLNHAVPGLDGYLKGANLRSPMDLSYSFASEQLIDRLAKLCRLDPVEFRRRNIKDERWRGVFEAVVLAAKWQPRRSAENGGDAVVRGRGVGLGTHRAAYASAVADIEVNRRTGVIVAKHLHVAFDCGIAVNPAIVESQVVGMSIQATSRVLKEAVSFSETGVTSLDWESYPVLRFAEHPEVTPIVMKRSDPSIGAGEEAIPAVGAAIANAFYDATGVQLAEYPMTPKRVLAALKS